MDKSINEVLAMNLAYFMEKKDLTQKALGAKAGLAQTTVGLYLHPERRKPGASGKPGSAKIAEVELLACGLGVEVWELLRNLSDEERAAYEQIESAFIALKPKLPDKGKPGDLPPVTKIHKAKRTRNNPTKQEQPASYQFATRTA